MGADVTQDEARQFVNTVKDAWVEIVAIMRAKIEQFIDAMQPVYRAMYDQYVAEGAIYGDTHEGMMRWMGEKTEAANLEAEAQRIRDHQWAVEDMQRIVAARDPEQTPRNP